MKRLISAILIMAMLFALPVYAEESSSTHEHVWELTKESISGTTITYTYTCSGCGETKTETEKASVSTAGVTYFTSKAKAAAYLAECAEDLPTDYIYVYTLEDSAEGSLAYAKEILEMAVELMDDYVARNLGTWNYGYTQTEYAEGWLIRTKFMFSYTDDTSNEDYVSSRVSSIISSLGISGKSDYTKAKAIYDWVCSNVSYDLTASTSERYTAYGALKNGVAVCKGYALLYYELATEAGLSCRFISGTSYGGSHAWNIVKVNGTWYNLDSSWDAGKSSYAYFLRGTTFFYQNHTPTSTYGITISASDYAGASTSDTGNSVQQSMAASASSASSSSGTSSDSSASNDSTSNSDSSGGSVSDDDTSDDDVSDNDVSDEEDDETCEEENTVHSLRADPRKIISLLTVDELTSGLSANEYFNTACAYRNMHEIYSRSIKNNSDFAGGIDKD